jgi:hypothetical protein
MTPVALTNIETQAKLTPHCVLRIVLNLAKHWAASVKRKEEQAHQATAPAPSWLFILKNAAP